MRAPRAAVLGLAGGLVMATVWAAPATAHTVTGVSPTNYRSRIIGTFPDLPGVTLRLLDLGRRVELINRGDTDVVVLGYEGEPYLRVGPDGVFENRRSPTVEANQATGGAAITTTTMAPAPPGAPVQATEAPEPDWRRTSSGHTARWRDHRTRWEGADPPAVQAAPGRAHIVSQWEILLRRAGTTTAVRGVITWVPGPSALPWLLLGLGCLVVTVAGAFSARWGWWLSAALGLLVAADVVTSIAAATASQSSVGGVVLEVLLGGFITTVAWVVGALAIGPLQRQRPTGLFAAAITALVMTLYSLPDALGLGRSQLPTDLPGAAARSCTAAALGLGVGLMVAVVIVLKRHPGLLPSNRPEDQPAGFERDGEGDGN